MQIEKLGVPVATILSQDFAGLGQSACKAQGFPAMPVVAVPHPFGNLKQDEVRRIADEVVDEIIHVLTAPTEKLIVEYGDKYTSRPASAERTSVVSGRINVPGSLETVSDFLYEQGLSDGLPVVPPTPERVEAMLSRIDRSRDELIAEIAPLWAQATVEKIAINAVMAGCLPECLPVVIAAIQAIAHPDFNLYSPQATTNSVSPLALINGPVRHEVDINFSSGALGPGRRANATIGRAIRLVMLNIGGATPGVLDMSTMGQPGKYGLCIGENEEKNPWQPFHVEMGFPEGTSVVTMIPICGTLNVMDTESKSGVSLLKTLAGSIAIQGTNNQFFGGRENPVLCLCPEHAALLAKDGYSKNDIRQYLWEHATIPLSAYSPEVARSIIEKSNPCPDGVTHPTRKPEDLLIIVAGGAGPHSIFMPTTGRHVLQPITRKDGTPVRSIRELKS